MKYSILFTLLTLSTFLSAQKEENIWYFINRAGANFNMTPPSALTNGQIRATVNAAGNVSGEGVATISNSAGDLLFYTDGSTIWHRNHGVMDGGTDLGGNATTTQSGVIVPWPQNANMYYVFSVDCEGGQGFGPASCSIGYTGLQYAVVDLSQNGGLGRVTSKANRLENSTTEKLTGIFHTNKRDIWVISHQYGNSTFNVYSITPSGINTTATQYNIGSVHPASAIGTIGYMKISPDGNRLAVAVWGAHFIEVFDFNRTTGAISNPRRINTQSGGVSYRPYGLEFSPTGRYLYNSQADARPSLTRIIRYDLTAADPQGSALLITQRVRSLFGALQLASDQKIYFAYFNSPSLSSISNADLATPTYTANAINLGGPRALFGLPNFIRGFTTRAKLTNICEGDNTRFEIVSNLTPARAVWNFGDRSPTVTSLTPTHRYAAAGNYSLIVDIDFTTGARQTLRQDITIDKSSPTLSAFPQLCNTSPAVGLTQGSPAGGTYSGTGIAAGTNTFNPTTSGPGTFNITYTYTNSNGCVGSVRGDLRVLIPQPITLRPTASNVCTSESPITMTAGPAGGTFAGSGVTGNRFSAAVAGVGRHTVTYTLSDACNSRATSIFNVQAPLSANLQSDTTVCSGDAAFNLKHRFTGTFTGRGITNNALGTFDARVAGAGKHTITFSYQDNATPRPCPNTETVDITVVDTFKTTFAALNTVCESAAAFALDKGTPAGGIYFGTGVQAGTNFNPLTAGGGSHRIGYTRSNTHSCSDTSYQTIQVTPNFTATLAPTANICIDAANVVLNSGQPVGGTYRIDGNVVTQIIPTVIAEGRHTLSYTVSQGACPAQTKTNTFTVHSAPRVRTLGSSYLLCRNEGNQLLKGVDPSGGIFAGAGVVNDTLFNTNTALGIYTLNYTYTDVRGCRGTIPYRVQIVDKPAIVFNALADVCADVDSIDLAALATPKGGTFSGTGVSGNLFIPRNAGTGTHAITYTYTTGLRCTDRITQNIRVLPVRSVTLPAIGNFCIDADSIRLTGATPVGGTYTLKGYSAASGFFFPRRAGIGAHTLTYRFTEANGCVIQAQKPINVLTAPVLNLGSDIVACSGAPVVLSAKHPSHSKDVVYKWSNGATTPSVSLTAVGSVKLKVEVRDTSNKASCTSVDSVQVTINQSPIVNIVEDTIRQCVPNFVSLNVSHPSHTAAIRYLWSTGETTPNITIRTLGQYSYTVQVINSTTGCSVLDTVVVSIGQPPKADLGADIVICEERLGLLLNASAPTSSLLGPSLVSIDTTDLAFLWNTGATTQNILVNTVGSKDYNVRITDRRSGCFDADTIKVTVHPSPILDLADTIRLCEYDLPFRISAGHSSHGNNMTYIWSNGSNDSLTVVDKLGNFGYLSTVTDKRTGCQITKTVYFEVSLAPKLDLGKDVVSCYEKDGILIDASDKGNKNPMRYLWSTGETTPQIRPRVSGDYSVVITDLKSNCSARDTVKLSVHPQFKVDLGADQRGCKGSPKTFNFDAFDGATHTGKPLVYAWSTGSNLPQTSLTVSQDTQVIATVFDPTTSCSLSDTVELIFTQIALNDLRDTAFCSNADLTLDAFHPSYAGRKIDYLWSNGDTTSSIKVNNDMTTRYSVKVTDLDLNCSQEAFVNVGIFPVPAANLGNDTIVCDSAITLNAKLPSHASNFSYLWSTGATTPSLTIQNQSGLKTYSVKVTNPNTNLNCYSEDDIRLNFIPFHKFSRPIVDICVDDVPKTISAKEANHPANLKYKWYDKDNQLVANNDQINVSQTATYTLEITDDSRPAATCVRRQKIDFRINDLPSPKITRQPNPTPNSLPILLSALSTNLKNLDLKWSFEGNDSSAFASSTDSTEVLVRKYGTYYLKVLNRVTGCENIDSFLVYSVAPSCRVPNALTPNQDNRNDYFAPVTRDLVRLKLVIFDYQGSVIYEKEFDTQKLEWTGDFSENLGWDGKFQGLELPEAKYLFQVQYEWLDEFKVIQQANQEGSLYLVR